MKFWVTLEGHDAEVECQAEGERLWVEVEGRRLEADFRRLPDGEVYSLLIEGRSHEVRVATTGGGLEVTLDGSTVPVEVRHPLEKLLQTTRQARHAGHGETVVAPMPGLVVTLRVKAGDLVTPGQAVVVVEAMKMQNELRAPRAGTVERVAVGEGETIENGDLLVVLG